MTIETFLFFVAMGIYSVIGVWVNLKTSMGWFKWLTVIATVTGIVGMFVLIVNAFVGGIA